MGYIEGQTGELLHDGADLDAPQTYMNRQGLMPSNHQQHHTQMVTSQDPISILPHLTNQDQPSQGNTIAMHAPQSLSATGDQQGVGDPNFSGLGMSQGAVAVNPNSYLTSIPQQQLGSIPNSISSGLTQGTGSSGNLLLDIHHQKTRLDRLLESLTPPQNFNPGGVMGYSPYPGMYQQHQPQPGISMMNLQQNQILQQIPTSASQPLVPSGLGAPSAWFPWAVGSQQQLGPSPSLSAIRHPVSQEAVEHHPVLATEHNISGAVDVAAKDTQSEGFVPEDTRPEEKPPQEGLPLSGEHRGGELTSGHDIDDIFQEER